MEGLDISLLAAVLASGASVIAAMFGTWKALLTRRREDEDTHNANIQIDGRTIQLENVTSAEIYGAIERMQRKKSENS